MSSKTKSGSKKTTRQYETKHAERSRCPIANALDIIGDKWTLLVIRDLLLVGKKSFSELEQSDEKIATNILSERLSRLIEAGLVARKKSQHDGRRIEYQLTNKGRDLLPVLLAIIRWSNKHIEGTFTPPESFFESFAKNESL